MGVARCTQFICQMSSSSHVDICTVLVHCSPSQVAGSRRYTITPQQQQLVQKSLVAVARYRLYCVLINYTSTTMY